MEGFPDTDDPVDVVKLRETAEERLRLNALKQKRRFDKARRNNINYKVKDTVYVQEQRKQLGKLEPRYKWPFLVEKLLPKDRYRL